MSSDYLMGNTNNLAVLTWTGLHDNHTFEETRRFMYNSIRDVVFLESQNGTAVRTNGNISVKFIIPTGFCTVFEGKPASIMRIKLDTTEHSPHILFISDPSVTTQFQVPWSLMSGDQVTLQGGEWAVYTIQLKETENTLHSDGGSCVDYPSNYHESYADCVDAEMREKILPTLGMLNVHMESIIINKLN